MIYGNKIRAIVFFVFSVGLSIFPLSASAVIVETASTLATTEGIKSLINSAIDKATDSGDYLAFRLGTELRLSIEAWEKSNSKLLDKAFSELSQQQQSFLSGTDRIATKLSDDVGKSLEKIEDISNQWQNLVSSTIIGDGVPVVSSYRPAIFRPIDVGKTFNIGIKGANLNREEAILNIPGAKVSTTGNTSISLLFSSTGLNPKFEDNKTSLLPATLTLYRPSENFFSRLFGGSDPIEFKLPVMVAPKKLGTYELIATYPTEVEKTEEKSEKFSHSSGDVQNNCRTYNRGPSIEGRYMRNFRPEVTRSGRASSHEMVSTNSLGFSLRICARRWTDASLARIGSGPGDRHVRVRWTEYWTETQQNNQRFSGAIEWGKDIPIKMPPNTASFVLKVKSFDGREYVFTGSGKKSLYDIAYDIAGKQVVISQLDPQILE